MESDISVSCAGRKALFFLINTGTGLCCCSCSLAYAYLTGKEKEDPKEQASFARSSRCRK